MTPTSLSPKQRTEILAAVKKSILKHHFNVAGVNYNDWAGRFDERSPTLLDVDLEEFEDGVRKALAELGSSHTVFYHERTNRLLPQHSINATLRAFAHDGQQHWHFLDIFEGGPADVAGIKRGDMLVAVDGIPCAPPAMPAFRIGETHRIAVSTGLGEQSREIAVSVPFRKGTKNRPPEDSILPRSHGNQFRERARPGDSRPHEPRLRPPHRRFARKYRRQLGFRPVGELPVSRPSPDRA